jgi:putative tRNA adenosine deaminase-associated protein
MTLSTLEGYGAAVSVIRARWEDHRVGYSALALARDPDGDWTGRDISLDDVADLEAAVELLRDEFEEDATVLLMVEEDDEWVAVVRVDPDGEDAEDDVRAFLSDHRAVDTSELAGRLLGEAVLLSEEDEDDDEDDDEADSVTPDITPAGDPDLLTDLGMTGPALVALCAAEGTLPGDVVAAAAEAVGAGDVLEKLRPA